MPLPCFLRAHNAKCSLDTRLPIGRSVDSGRRHVGVYFKALIMKLSASRPFIRPSVRRPRPSRPRPPSIGLPPSRFLSG